MLETIWNDLCKIEICSEKSDKKSILTDSLLKLENNNNFMFLIFQMGDNGVGVHCIGM